MKVKISDLKEKVLAGVKKLGYTGEAKTLKASTQACLPTPTA